MYGEGFQGVDLHDRTHIPEVDWMSNRLQPIQHQETEISFRYKKIKIKVYTYTHIHYKGFIGWLLKNHIFAISFKKRPQSSKDPSLLTTSAPIIAMKRENIRFEKEWLLPPLEWSSLKTHLRQTKYLLLKTMKSWIKACHITIWLHIFSDEPTTLVLSFLIVNFHKDWKTKTKLASLSTLYIDTHTWTT